MTLEEEKELIALGQKWLEQAKDTLEQSKNLEHPNSLVGGIFLGRSQGKATAANDLSEFLNRHGTGAKLEYIRKLMGENK